MTKFYPQKSVAKQKNLLRKEDDQEEEQKEAKEDKPHQDEVCCTHICGYDNLIKTNSRRTLRAPLVSWETSLVKLPWLLIGNRTLR